MAKGNFDELRRHIDRDKTTAKSVRQAAREEINSEYCDPVSEDITGAPSGLASFRKFKREQKLALDAIHRDLYFAKVETHVRRANGGEEDRTYLVTKSRYSGGVLCRDDWMVVAWTAPITAEILNKPVGERITLDLPRRVPQELEISAAADFGTILPRITDTHYRLLGLERFVEDESESAIDSRAEVVREAPPEVGYEAATDFGLHEIIELADVDQRSAMHLPFHETVLVEGPPGSGKTSIALMRVPCLIDRQWEELGLDPNEDAPFHDVSRMRVLVMNEEMVDYLSTLIRSVGVRGLLVDSLPKFCRRLCSQAGTLAGIIVRESGELTALKHNPHLLRCYWKGFKQSVQTFMTDGLTSHIEDLERIHEGWALDLKKRLVGWNARLQKCDWPEGQAKAPSLSESLSRWRQEASQSIPDQSFDADSGREDRELLANFTERVQQLAKSIFDRDRLVQSMLQTREFAEFLEQSGRSIDSNSIREWVEQTKHEVQHMSNGDLLLHAWLATHLMLSRSDSGTRTFGARHPEMTHVVIDEAQDIAAGHIYLVTRLMREDGTLTLVGDIRQRVSHGGYFESWDDLPLDDYSKAVFTVNHRQSKPLGAFIKNLHRCLYGVDAEWKPSNRRSDAPKPRLRPKRGYGGLADVIAEEVRTWRELIPNATVGILYYGKQWNRASNFARRIEESLGDTLTEVRVANSSDTGQLSRTDCAIVASVENTKGLEFDAVVFLDRHQDWKEAILDVAEVARNGLYVAASRAKQGLSLIIDDRCELVRNALDQELYDLIPVTATSEVDDDQNSLEFEKDDVAGGF